VKLFAVTDSGKCVEIDAEGRPHYFYAGHIGKVNCLALADGILATGGADSVTNIWEVGQCKAHLHSLASFRDEIVTCGMAKEFMLVASATRDGSIFLISMGTGVAKRVIDIAPEIPLLVAVTSGWGFVVLHSRRIDRGISSFYLWVFTVNGELIRKREIGFSIQNWTTWTSPSGFDYFVAATETGRLYTFEAFYLDVEAPFTHILPRIVALQYIVARQVLAVVADRQVQLYPVTQMKMERFDRTVFGIQE
jgi:hypothetical protein